MAIIRWTPARRPAFRGAPSDLGDFDLLRRQMMNLFDRYTEPPFRPDQARSGVFPPLNISEDEDNLYVTAELPGVKTDDLDIRLENDKLIIRGERKLPEADAQANFHRREREAGTFRRAISLPVKIDSEKVGAVSKNGVLEITLPKAAEVKPRQISVQAG